MSELKIRPFDAERDTPIVREIVSEIWVGGNDALMEQEYGIIGGRPWGEWMSESVLAYLNDDGTRSFIAEKDDEVVGFCSYVIDEGRSLGTVGYNGVAKKRQGERIGTAMLDFVMDCFNKEGMQFAAVIVAQNDEHIPARKNYEKHGFHNIMGLQYMVQKL